MASRRFNVIFKDGNEYETTLYESGGIKIKSEYGGVILELGHYQMMNVVEILDRIRDDLKWADRYNNPIETVEEVERMDLNNVDVSAVLLEAADAFVESRYFEIFDEDEKKTFRAMLGRYNVYVCSGLMDAETAKLDRMAEAGE